MKFPSLGRVAIQLATVCIVFNVAGWVMEWCEPDIVRLVPRVVLSEKSQTMLVGMAVFQEKSPEEVADDLIWEGYKTFLTEKMSNDKR